MRNVNEYVKALVAALTAGAATLTTALADGAVTSLEGLLIAASAVTAFGAVYGAPNKDPEKAALREEVYELRSEWTPPEDDYRDGVPPAGRDFYANRDIELDAPSRHRAGDEGDL